MAYLSHSPLIVAQGGTGLTSITSHYLIVGNGTGTPNLLAPSATSGVAVISQGSSADPVYGTVVVAGGGTGLATLTQYYTLVGAGTSNVSLIAPSATAGIPYVSGGSAANPSFTTAVVAGGGTGVTTMTTAYAPVCSGTSATGALQVASTGLSSVGYILTSTGSSSLPSFQAPPTTTTLTLTYISTSASTYVVLTTDALIGVDSSGGARQVNLPNAPATGRIFTIKDSTGSAATNNITVTTVGGTVTLDGATTYVMNTAYQSIDVFFDGANYQIW